MNKYRTSKRQLLKEKALIYLGGKKCRVCGIDHLPTPCYDFHHTVGNKMANLSFMIASGDWKEIRKELDRGKCVVLCKNCHALIHTLRFG